MGGDPAFFFAFAQLLGDDCLQTLCKHGTDLGLFIGRECINDPVDGFGGTVGVQSTENQHSHRGAGKPQPDGIQFPHFANEDDIRVGTHGSAQGFGEGTGMKPHFPVDNGTVFVFVNEFHRVFNGDDMLFLGIIDIVDLPLPVGPVTRTRPLLS